MAFLQYPRSNSRLYSFKSTQVLSGADVFEGLMAVSVKAEIEGRDLVFGSGPIAYGRPRGQLKIEFSMTFVADAFYSFARANPQFMDTEYDLTFVQEEGAARDVIDIRQILFDSFEINPEGTDATEIEVPGQAINLFLNNQPLMFGDALSQFGVSF